MMYHYVFAVFETFLRPHRMIAIGLHYFVVSQKNYVVIRGKAGYLFVARSSIVPLTVRRRNRGSPRAQGQGLYLRVRCARLGSAA